MLILFFKKAGLFSISHDRGSARSVLWKTPSIFLLQSMNFLKVHSRLNMANGIFTYMPTTFGVAVCSCLLLSDTAKASYILLFFSLKHDNVIFQSVISFLLTFEHKDGSLHTTHLLMFVYYHFSNEVKT